MCRALLSASLILLMMMSPLLQAAPAPAGSIYSTASVSYFNDRLGLVEVVDTNTVEVIIDEVPAVEVLGNSDLRLSRGAYGEHMFEIRNTGNVDLTVSPYMDISGEDNLFDQATLYWDENANGRIDGNETALSMDSTIDIPMGESVYLIYSFHVSSDAQLDDAATSVLFVEAWTENQVLEVSSSESATGQVIIMSATLELAKSATWSQSEDGDTLTYMLELRNNSEGEVAGYSEIAGNALSIDGAAAEGVIVRDEIPLNTVFRSVGSSGQLQPLYHIRGEGEQSYSSTAPGDPADVDALAWFSPEGYPVGRSTDIFFSVFVPVEMGTVTVRNTAETFIPTDSGPTRILSNEIVHRRQVDAAARLTFIDPANGQAAAIGDLDADTMLELVAGACNTTDSEDTVQIDVSSRITGDMETISGRETGDNTATFRSARLPVAFMNNPVAQDGVLASAEGDTLTATASCDGTTVTTTLSVRPGSFAFDSITNNPVADVRVNLVDALGNRVATALSDARGYFALGDVSAGSYRIEAEPPAEYSFPSVRPSFSGYQRNADTRASYGEEFQHAGGHVELIDLPLDPYYGVPLALEKSADKTRIGSGELVSYTIRAQNNMNQALVGAEIMDRFPQGTQLVAGTVRVDGEMHDDPAVDEGMDHIFELGDIGPLESRELTYVLRFAATARQGRHDNAAILYGNQAGTGEQRSSAVAEASVVLDDRGGVFSREGTVIGSVFMDCNANGIRDDRSEPGVPGVQILTQEGLSVVTDERGRYSLFGLRPVSHVLALQDRTLPEGARPTVQRAADMGRAGSRMVAMKRGELRAEHFPLEGCTPEVLSSIADRKVAFLDGRSANNAILSDLPIDAARSDSRSVRDEAGLATQSQIYGAGEAASDDRASTRGELQRKVSEAQAERQTLDAIIKTLNADFAFMDLRDGDSVRRQTITVRLKGPADLAIRLMVNGVEQPGSRIGERTSWAGGNVQAMEYVAIKLKPGQNTLEMVGKGPFGNDRARETVTITAPGEPERIEIVAPAEAPATPGTVVPVVVRILDRDGVPVQASGTVTLSARLGRWDVTDIRPQQIGVQAFIDNGEATFGLLAPQASGEDVISVRGGFGKAEARITFLPDLTERVLVGVLEGAVALNGSADLIETDRLSAFEDTATGLRGELYLKGRIRGDALLTLRYTSDRDTSDRLFRDIRADEYYPVYGDNSERGFDAQSSTNLFIKVERGGSYFLYGDITVQPESDAFRLGGYQTVTTGAKAHWQDEHVQITVFAARTGQKNRVVEFAGRGISGPYDIDLTDFREGSDRVDLLVRDKDSGEILSEERLDRLSDYVLDYFLDTVIFDRPVPQTDEDGNPVSVRFAYQLETGTDRRYWLYGAEARVQLGENASAGARVIRSDAPRGTAEREAVYAVFIETAFTRNGMLQFELAQAVNPEGDAGNAARLSFEKKGDRAALKIEATHTDANFAPTGSSAQRGTDKVRLEFDAALTEQMRLKLSSSWVADRVAGTEMLDGAISGERKVSDNLSLRSGLRFDHDLKADGDATDLALTVGGDWTPEFAPDLTLKADLEQPFLGHGTGLLRLGAEYRVRDGFLVKGSTELAFARDDRGPEVTNSRLDVEYTLRPWLRGRSSLEASGGGAGQARFVQGFNGTTQLTEQLSLSYSLEHTEPLSDAAERLTSLAIGGKWEAADGAWIMDADIDQTFEEDGRTFFASLGVAGRLTPDWTLLGRSRLAADQRGDTDSLRHRLRFGAAYRPIEDPRFEFLGWYEHQLEENGQRSEQHLWSLAGTWEVNRNLRLNGKYAGRYSELELPGSANSVEAVGLMQLAQAGASFDILPEKLEATVNAFRIWDDQDFSTFGLGAELGFVVGEGTMLSVGYNATRDRAPNAPSLYQDGAYVRIRLKLDSSLWDRLDNFLGG
ncbi:hypothetical protein ATO5_03660 [Loktanella sp. 22II-4b]|nr:hypothetical protein ATO5_03660 [Loktanella sp. 22II-4b]